MEGVWQESLLQCPAARRGGRGVRLLLSGALQGRAGRGQGARQCCQSPEGRASTHTTAFFLLQPQPPPKAGTIFPRQEQMALSPKCKSCLGAWEGGALKELLFFFYLLFRVRFAFTSLFYMAQRNGVRSASPVSLLLQPNQTTPPLLGTSCSISVQLLTVPALQRVREAY